MCFFLPFFGRNPCKRELLLLSLLDLFSSFYAWQPLEKGVLKFEIVLEVFDTVQSFDI